MDELEYILAQGTFGVHLLFENDQIKKVFSKKLDDLDIPENYSDEKVKNVEALMEEFISVPSISARKAFFNALTESEQDMIIRSYFNIIENNILSEGRLQH